jgi:hypothetical protein
VSQSKDGSVLIRVLWSCEQRVRGDVSAGFKMKYLTLQTGAEGEVGSQT